MRWDDLRRGPHKLPGGSSCSLSYHVHCSLSALLIAHGLWSLSVLSLPRVFISLSLSLFSFPLFSPLWVAFDAFAFYECFSLTPASPCLSFLSVKQWVFFLSNNVDKLQLVKCHFPCLLPFWASFPPWSPQQFTFNCASNTRGVHQCGMFGARLLWRGGRKLLKYFPGFRSVVCNLCVYTPLCYHRLRQI